MEYLILSCTGGTMKKISIVVLGVLACLLFAHYFYLPEAPEITRGEISTTPGSSGGQFGLVDLWNALVRETGVSNESAVLVQLNQRIAENGTVQYARLYFTGEEDGKPCFYEVAATQGGNVSFKRQPFDHLLRGSHPLSLFREVDRIDFAALGSRTATLQTLRHDGARRYDESSGNICVLSGGSFRPLKEVAFPEGVCWNTIEITLQKEPGGDLPEREGSGHLIAFVERDLAMADDVVYASTGEDRSLSPPLFAPGRCDLSCACAEPALP